MKPKGNLYNARITISAQQFSLFFRWEKGGELEKPAHTCQPFLPAVHKLHILKVS